MRAIQLSKILRDAVPAQEQTNVVDFTVDTDDVGENGSSLSLAPAAAQPALTVPVVVNVECIRCFTPRRENRGVGTRLTFIDGGGFAVAETYEQVYEIILAAGHTIHAPRGLAADSAATH